MVQDSQTAKTALALAGLEGRVIDLAGVVKYYNAPEDLYIETVNLA